MRAWSSDRGRSYQPAETESFETEILPDQVIAFMRRVAFVEHEINDVQRGVKTRLQFGPVRHFEREATLSDLPLGAHDALRDGGFVGEESAGDLAHAEAAHGLQAQSDARVPRNFRMATHEDHAQLVITKLLFESGIIR